MTAVLPMTALRDGQMVAVRVEGEDVLVCRVDGEFFAVTNRCPHARQPLHTGRLRGAELICPLHGARFDVREGHCLRGPAAGGLRTWRVWLEGGKVHVAPR